MTDFKIGILRETRRYDDQRAAITPASAEKIMARWPGLKIFAQPSETRIFKDEEYRASGVTIQENLENCDLLVGVKEVSDEALIPGKTYLMFAHVAKQQAHNRQLLKTLSEKKITLLDYEYFTDENGIRLVAFGHWAGIAGAYYAIRGMMKKFAGKQIQPPSGFYNAATLFDSLRHIKIPEVKVVLTGDGRVGQGAASVLEAAGFKKAGSDDFLGNKNQAPVFCMLPFQDYVRPKVGSGLTANDFFSFPEHFESTFKPYTKVADVYLACHFWDPRSPAFFTKEEVKSPDFKISFVADISCDVPGPVASTIRTSTHSNPFYDVNRETLEEQEAFSDSGNITVMAVDNLPAALPADASETFAEALFGHVFPALIPGIKNGITERATILEKGRLTPRFSYLEDFLKEQET